MQESDFFKKAIAAGLTESMADTLELYLEGYKPGSFTTAVLENRLTEAVRYADATSLTMLPTLVEFIRWEMPADCSGSPAKVAAWIDRCWAEKKDAHE